MTEKKIKKALNSLERSIQAVAKIFIDKYFCTDPEAYCYYDWVDEVGGNLEIGDYVFNFSRIKEALEINCSKDLLIKFYDYEVKCYYDPSLPRYNFKTWVKYYSGLQG